MKCASKHLLPEVKPSWAGDSMLLSVQKTPKRAFKIAVSSLYKQEISEMPR